MFDYLKFEPARNDAERYEQLILLETWSVFWRLHWGRMKQFGGWIVRFWSVLWLGFSCFTTGHLDWPALWQWQMWFAGCVSFFLIAWPSVLIFSMLTYYFRLPLLLLNPLCWVANSIYGYDFVDDLWLFRRMVIIRAQDRLLLEHGIDTDLRS